MVDTAAKSTSATPVLLPRTRGRIPVQGSVLTALHLSLIVIPSLIVTTSLKLLWHYLLFRPFSPLVQEIGRPLVGGFGAIFSHDFFRRASVAETRLLFKYTRSYDKVLDEEEEKWVEKVQLGDVGGRWIAPPGSERGEGERVLLWTHGGAFTLDGGPGFIKWGVKLVQALHAKGIRFAILWIDYKLAPEYIFPTQLTELIAAYHYLVNSLHLPESHVTVGGDSAGGNLTLALLLHLSRPSPLIRLPPSLGSLPKRPGAAFLVSPWVNLIPAEPSYATNAPFDFIAPSWVEHGAAHYVGGDAGLCLGESWNPLRALLASPKPLKGFVVGNLGEGEEVGVEGLELLRSPYVNPSVVGRDGEGEWWREACPGEGRTLVSWGGKEIFTDPLNEFVRTLEDAGVAPTTIFGDLNAHDWLPSCETMPGLWETKTMKEKGWALRECVAWFEKGYETPEVEGKV